MVETPFFDWTFEVQYLLNLRSVLIAIRCRTVHTDYRTVYTKFQGTNNVSITVIGFPWRAWRMKLLTTRPRIDKIAAVIKVTGDLDLKILVFICYVYQETDVLVSTLSGGVEVLLICEKA